MFEAAIIVTKKGPDYLVNLVNAHTDELITYETVAGADFVDGFSGIQVGGVNYTPAALLADFEAAQATGVFAREKDAGKVLHRLIAPGKVDLKWRALWVAHPKLITHLELQPDEWSELPWKLLCDPSNDECLFNHPSGRTIELPHVRKEVAIIVTQPAPGADYVVKLVNAHTDTVLTVEKTPGAAAVLAEETVTAADFANGFADVQVGGQNYTKDQLLTGYEATAVDGQFTNTLNAGRLLFRLITPGKVGTKWRELRAQHASMTTLLELHPPEWSKLPWELVYDDTIGRYLFRQTSGQTMGHRFPNIAHKDFSPRWPLRLLVVVGGETTDRWKAEIQAIKHAAWKFSLRLDLRVAGFPECDADSVIAKIKEFRPHIFHYIGHGTNRLGGALVLATRNKITNNLDNVDWSHADISEALADLATSDPSCIPRVVVLNACQTAKTGDPAFAGQVLETSVAKAFQETCGGAVIAMRGDIRENAAFAFSAEFYRRLAEDGVEQIDQAYAAACRAVRQIAAYTDECPQWTLPRIYYAKTVAAVLPIQRRLRPFRGFQDDADSYRDLQELRAFVNQEVQRGEVFYSSRASSWLCGGHQNSPVMLVKGDADAGKTWFLKFCLYTAYLEGYDIFYFDLSSGDEAQDLSHFLKVLRRGPGPKTRFFGNSLVDPEIDSPRFKNDDPERYKEAFADFRKAVDAFETTPHTPENLVAGDEDRRGPIIRALSAGIKKVVTGEDARKLFIVFDHPESITEKHWNQYVMRGLIQPASLEDLGRNLRIAVSVRPDDLGKLGFQSGRDYFTPPPISPIEVSKFSDLFRNYCYLQLQGTSPAQLEVLMKKFDTLGSSAQDALEQPWLPGQLQSLFNFVIPSR